MSPADLRASLDVVAQQAKVLREAGVQSVKIGDLELVLLPPDPPDVDLDDDDEKQALSALDDPDTFGGRPPPRRRRPEHET
jgi:hypothetical protein